MDQPVLQADANHNKYQVARNCWLGVRGCAMSPVEHPHGGGHHQYEDFARHTSGAYHHVSSISQDGQILGSDTGAGDDYRYVAISWNDQLRGQDPAQSQ